MIKVTFVCLGNICRSPMAELIFTDMVKRNGLSDKISITSCATCGSESGSHMYSYARRTLQSHGIEGDHIARKIDRADLESDYILVMDESNYRDVTALKGAPKERIFKLCHFTDRPRDVADPWYTRDFETAYRDIEDGCKSLLAHLKEKHSL